MCPVLPVIRQASHSSPRSESEEADKASTKAIKHDGFRTLLRIDRSDIRAFTRGGHDWSDKYGLVVEACRKLGC